jgi:putative FmdB family regulatory protein
MMLILYDFKCEECDHTEEKLVVMDLRVQECEECHGRSKRVISPVRCHLEGHSGDFPSASAKWEREHEKQGRKASESHHEGWK